MPHQCVRCNKLYENGAAELLKGCSCGSRFFFFMKREDVDTVKNMTVKLTREEKEQIEHDVMDIVGAEVDDKPVILDLESIRVLKPGKFEISLVDLFRGKPLVYKLEEGKYIIDIASTFESEEL